MIWNGQARLLDNRDIGHGHFLAVLEAPVVARALRPAQFVMLRVRDGTDPLLSRPFSVARIGMGGTVDLLYKPYGRGTQILSELRPGAAVGLVGPLGRPFPDPPAGARLVLAVAGGIGVAPFPLLGDHLRRLGTPRRLLLYGARRATDLVGRDLLEAAGWSLEVATDDGSEGRHALVPALLDETLAALDPAERARTFTYVCGPTRMMAATDAVLGRHGCAGQFSVEAFMGCGFGVCLSCVVPLREGDGEDGGYRRVCVDGPTFPAGSLRWPGSLGA